jgi:hypothetical protein
MGGLGAHAPSTWLEDMAKSGRELGLRFESNHLIGPL